MKRTLGISAAALLLFSAAASAQGGIIVPRHVLDSIANPPVDALPGLVFDREAADLGELRDDSAPVSVIFLLTNCGNEPVSVRRISTSCGCTTAVHDTLGITPGASTEIRVFYNPKGQSGVQTRKIYIYTDRSPLHPSAALSLRVNVVPGAVPQGFPVVIGSLACSRRSVSFSLVPGQARAVERISCRNIGKSPLRLTAMDGFCPAWLSFRTEPETIAPGGEGDIVLSLKVPELPAERQSGSAAVVVVGVEGRPSQRTFEVYYEFEKNRIQ